MNRTDSPPFPRRDREGERHRRHDNSGGTARKHGFSPRTALVLVLLLSAPAAAVYRLSASVDYRILLCYWGAISLVTYVLYVLDKRKAQREEWRIPEQTLHIAELLGGWAAAFVAQRVIRHKISKRSYQWKFWLIVAVHQYVALDFLLHHGLTRGAVRTVEGWMQ